MFTSCVQSFRSEASKSIALTDSSPKGAQCERFIAHLAVSMRTNFQFHVLSHIDMVRLLLLLLLLLLSAFLACI